MRPVLVAAHVILITLSAGPTVSLAQRSDVACRRTGKEPLTIEDMARIAKASSGSNAIPLRFSKPLGYPAGGDRDLAVQRTTWLNKPADRFRAFDIPVNGVDYVVFFREGKEVLTLWRVTPSGRILVTVQALASSISVVPNSGFVSKLNEVCGAPYDFLKAGTGNSPTAKTSPGNG